MMQGVRKHTHLCNFMLSANVRFMSAASAASIKDRFEAAYEQRMNSIKKSSQKK